MAFPTIPTAGAGRLLTGFDTTPATATFPSLSSLTKNSGDLLIAIIAVYQSTATDGAVFSGWGGGFTEFVDQRGGTTQMSIGAAYKWSDGTETGTFNVTVGATVTGHAGLILMSIPGAHASTPPEGGTIAVGTTGIADPGALVPSWGAKDTLWIAAGASGETGTGGAYTGMGAAAGPPTNYGDAVSTGESADAIGAIAFAVAFRQNNTASEDIGPWSAVDVSNARNVALAIAIPPVAGIDVNIGQATETELAQPIQVLKVGGGGGKGVARYGRERGRYPLREMSWRPQRRPRRTFEPSLPPGGAQNINIGQAFETDTAQAITRLHSYNLGQPSETDTSQLLTHLHSYNLGQATETDTSQAISRLKSKTLGQSTETDTAQPITRVHSYTLGQALETDTAQPIARLHSYTLGLATETDTAFSITRGGRNVDVNQATETDTSQAIGRLHSYTLGQAIETDTSQPITRRHSYTLGQPSEIDLAQPIAVSKSRTLGQAVETDTAGSISHGVVSFVDSKRRGKVGQTGRERGRFPLRGEPYTYIARRTSTAGTQFEIYVPPTNINIGQAVETDTAQAITVRKHYYIEIGVPVGGMPIPLPGGPYYEPVAETDIAQPITLQLPNIVGQALETDTAQPITRLKSKVIGQATSTNTAQPITRLKSKTIGQASSTNTAQPISVLKLRTLGQSTETDTSQIITPRRSYLTGISSETDLAQSITRRKLRLIGQALEIDFAQAIGDGSVILPELHDICHATVSEFVSRTSETFITLVAVSETVQAVTAITTLTTSGTIIDFKAISTITEPLQRVIVPDVIAMGTPGLVTVVTVSESTGRVAVTEFAARTTEGFVVIVTLDDQVRKVINVNEFLAQVVAQYLGVPTIAEFDGNVTNINEHTELSIVTNVVTGVTIDPL